MPKTWNEKLTGSKPPHVSVLDKPFAGVPAGARLFVASPTLVRDYMSAIPAGQSRTIVAMREEFAARNEAKATCPMTASIFARIAAEAACEDMAGGKRPDDVTPFWRLIDPNSPLAHKLTCGAAFIRQMRATEAPRTRG
jgi:hypothetical protein